MAQLFEFIPVLIFFLVYQFTDLVTATIALMVTMAIHAAVEWRIKGKLERSRWLALGLVLLFGGATVFTRNPLFIQWKPTILQWILALVFLGSHFVGGGKVVIRRLLEGKVALPDAAWVRLNLGWVVFFFVTGGLNLWVAWTFSEEIWVRFKLFGLMGLTLVFVLLQAVYLVRHARPGDEGQ
ncbi:MAG: septation protein A [Magnetococcales bacterium]|nr:septation protein A [Magnetococcales bacterium]